MCYKVRQNGEFGVVDENGKWIGSCLYLAFYASEEEGVTLV